GRARGSVRGGRPRETGGAARRREAGREQEGAGYPHAASLPADTPHGTAAGRSAIRALTASWRLPPSRRGRCHRPAILACRSASVPIAAAWPLPIMRSLFPVPGQGVVLGLAGAARGWCALAARSSPTSADLAPRPSPDPRGGSLVCRAAGREAGLKDGDQ